MIGPDTFSGDVPCIAPDGNGGAFVVWSQSYTAVVGIHVQHLDERGVATWPSSKLLHTFATGESVIASDGSGGAIVVWRHYTTDNNIRAQRFDVAGNALWTSGGVIVCNAPDQQLYPIMLADGAGGATIAWYDDRSGMNASDIYVQRLNGAGVPQWTANGVALCTAAQAQSSVTMVPVAPGELVLTWQDNRNASQGDVYAQRINASGNAMWAANGVPVCAHWQPQLDPRAATDGVGGVLVAWSDGRVSGGSDIYAQRLLPNGTTMWATDGVPVCSATGYQISPVILADGAGGAMIAWNDNRSGYSMYAQRITENGFPLWSGNGVFVGYTASAIAFPRMVDDGAGGFVVVWTDTRSAELDIYGQRVSANGSVLWTANGVPICTRPGEESIQSVAPDGRGGFLLAWNDYDQGSHVHRIESKYGEWGHPEPSIISVSDVPADDGGFVEIEWKGSDRDVVSIGTITQYAILRAVGAPPPVGSWQEVATTPATLAPTYSLNVPTTEDSTAGDPAVHYFAVVARTANPLVSFESAADDGYSVDNQTPTGIGNTPQLTALALLPNSPNPFSESTVLHIGVPRPSDVRIDVFDVAGRRVRAMQTSASTGWQNVTLTARDERGVRLASGVYLLRVSTPTATRTQKLVVSR